MAHGYNSPFEEFSITFELLQKTRTAAVFQLESSGMRDLIKRLKPDQFDDLVALVALFRPGPLQSGMVDDFITRKHSTGAAEIDYLHPDLEPVLASTYGVILYQEQVMQIAMVAAGFSGSEADLLRRSMAAGDLDDAGCADCPAALELRCLGRARGLMQLTIAAAAVAELSENAEFYFQQLGSDGAGVTLLDDAFVDELNRTHIQAACRL